MQPNARVEYKSSTFVKKKKQSGLNKAGDWGKAGLKNELNVDCVEGLKCRPQAIL